MFVSAKQLAAVPVPAASGVRPSKTSASAAGMPDTRRAGEGAVKEAMMSVRKSAGSTCVLGLATGKGDTAAPGSSARTRRSCLAEMHHQELFSLGCEVKDGGGLGSGSPLYQAGCAGRSGTWR